MNNVKIPDGYFTEEFPFGDFIIETLHEDGQKDVARMIDGQIYLYDVKTQAPVIAYKPIKSLPTFNP